jgi:hypothetical protein
MGGAELRGSCENYFDDISYLLMVRGESAGIDPRNILVAARQCTVQHYSWPTQLEQLYGSGRGGRGDTPHAYRRLNLVLAPS